MGSVSWAVLLEILKHLMTDQVKRVLG